MEKIIYGENNPKLCTSFNNLGMVNFELGNFNDAEIYFQKAIELKKNLQGEHTQALAAYFCNLGLVYKEQGKINKAED